MSGHDRTLSEDIYGPNFGNALPSAVAAQDEDEDEDEDVPSQNPPPRQQNADVDSKSQPAVLDPEQEDDFFDRYPGATPKKRSALDTVSAQVLREENTETLEEQSEPLPYSMDSQVEGTTTQTHQSVEPMGSMAATQISHSLSSEGDQEQPVFEPNESSEWQTQRLGEIEADLPAPSSGTEEQIQEQGQEQNVPPLPGTGEIRTLGDGLEGPEAHYEHQSEITEMEDAVDESVAAPLLDDEEGVPTVVDVSDGPNLGTEARSTGSAAITHSVSDAQTPLPPITRSFTTNFTDLAKADQHVEDIPEQASKEQADKETEWPAFGDDKTFGELLDEHIETTSHEASRGRPEVGPGLSAQLDGDDFGQLLGLPQSTLPTVGANQVFGDDGATLQASVEKVDDLAAAWGAALDDDDLLEESNELDPSTLFGDDDDDFLAEDDDSFLGPSQNQTNSEQQARTQPTPQQTVSYIPHSVQSQAAQQNTYGIQSMPVFGQYGRSVGTPETGLQDIYSQPRDARLSDQQQLTRPGPLSAQSFVGKSKGGYQSPYDLPMDVSKPRRRPQQQALATSAVPHVPPPRSSSQSSRFSTDSAALSQGLPLQQRAPSVQTPPGSSHGIATASTAHISSSVRSNPKSDSSFFADLPVAPKLRARPSAAYTPQAVQTPPVGPSIPMQQSAPPAHPSRPAAPPQQYSASSGVGLGFRQPERLPLLPEQPTAAPTQALDAPALTTSRYSPNAQLGSTVVQSRYSPAPTAPASTTSRYSPAPVAQPGQAKARYGPSPSRNPSGTSGSHYFAPRTSSPLASQSEKPHPPLPADLASPISPSKVNGTHATYTAISPPPPNPVMQRSRTQSPSATMKNPRGTMHSLERPTSAADISSGRSYAPSLQPSLMRNHTDVRTVHQERSGPVLPHRRQFSRELSFAAPQDERGQDQLQRWRGHPIFSWTAGGAVLYSLPQQTPFYATGHAIPAIKCTPGSVSLQDATTFFPMNERNAHFPGPLTARSKGRKKEVLSWIHGKVEDLERTYEAAQLDFNMDSSLRKRNEEKVVLWKIAKLLVENDGALEGKPEVVADTRKILLPNAAQMNSVSDLQSPIAPTVQTEPVDKRFIFELRQALLEGDRERAVWLAEEKKLWGHAMLIASTLGPDVWKQVIQSFVRSQVKSAGSDARSMAALYQIFAGNSDECVDELVPPSARAGFQMISKTDGSVSGNPLEGLDQWRETLGLVISNRTSNDGQSLVSLGKLLASYGRVEAAHTCYLFARSFVKHSGADDPETHFALLGANHQTKDETFGSDLDSILLTEIYEWSSSLSMPSTAVPYVPHLQSFKLVHAQQLAASGLKTKAQHYCSHITSAYTSTTRPSQYYHPIFTQAVTDLSAFLAQSPHDGKGSSSLFRKEVMNKASSGAASWFTKFVSGDDDTQTNGSGAGIDQIGTPFSGVNSATPPISRATSSAELYSSMTGGITTPGVTSPTAYAQPLNSYAPTATNGRYGPYGVSQTQVPESRPVASRSVSRYAPQDSPSATSYVPQPTSSPAKAAYEAGILGAGTQQTIPALVQTTSNHGSPYNGPSRRGSAQDPMMQSSYEPKPILPEVNPYSYTPPMPLSDKAPATIGQSLANEEAEPETAPAAYEGYEAPTSSYGYEPPSTSYRPYEPEPDSPEDAPKPKKKGIMDLDDEDDDALAKQAAALRKSQADREADEAFRKAAEADASRDNKDDPDNKKGWFGGWFKKDANVAPGPIRAKLGDQSSFVYDETLKKWVNKKGGAETETAASATPPPPRTGPSSRVTSGAMGPPSSGVPSRVASASGMAPPMGMRPPTSGSGPAFPGSGPPSRAGTPASLETSSGPVNGDGSASHPPPLAPPSRPGTGMSNASSLDDLLGAPGAGRKAGGTIKGKKKGGRYVDVMAGK